MMNSKQDIVCLNDLLRKIYQYEFGLILLILDMLKYSLVYKYFKEYDVQVRYCYIHDQGCIMSYPRTYPVLVNIFTRTCNNYCELELISKFTKYFIQNYDKIKNNNYDLDFKLEWFMRSFYDFKKDKLCNKIPLPISLFYEQCKIN